MAIRDTAFDTVIKSYPWSHNDDEFGVGGEKLFCGVLSSLGYAVEFEEVY